MAEERASKKLWNRAAWKDAGFFLTYLRPHYNVFIPALIALAITGGMTIIFIKELAAVAGKGIGGATGPAWMAELNHSVWFLVGIVAVQAFIAFWRILLFAKASERALAALRLDTFSRIIRLPMATLNRRRVGDIDHTKLEQPGDHGAAVRGRTTDPDRDRAPAARLRP